MNAVLSYVEQSDFRVFGRLRGWSPPRWFHLWMVWATRLGDGWMWVLALLALLGGGPRFAHVLGAAASSAALTNALLVLLKRSFRRKRPCDHAASSPAAGESPPYFPSDPFSFPSGHSMNACALGSVIALAFPPLAPAAVVLAASIGASRVALGFHFVSDVLVGAVLGALIGLVAFAAIVGG